MLGLQVEEMALLLEAGDGFPKWSPARQVCRARAADCHGARPAAAAPPTPARAVGAGDGLPAVAAFLWPELGHRLPSRPGALPIRRLRRRRVE